MSRRQKRAVLYSSPLAGLLVLAVFVHLKTSALQADARLLAETGRGVMNVLKEYAQGLLTGDADRVAACYAEDYANPDEAAWSARPVSERDGIRVTRWELGARGSVRRDDAVEQVTRTVSSLGTVEQSKFKLARVEELSEAGTAVVRGVLWLRGAEAGGGSFETFLRLRLWMGQNDAGTWRIQRQELIDGQTVSGPRRGFGDVADEAGLDFVAQRNPRFATPEWYPHRFGILKYGSAGTSAADYDGDGWYDVFFADGESARLYRNLGAPDGQVRFSDVTAAAGLPVDLEGVNVALFADFDNDGDPDLVMGRFTSPSLLYRNDGPGPDGHVRFSDVTDEANLGRGFVTVAAVADYDLDGDLDLYLGRYLDPRINLPTTLFYTRNSEGNSLLRNDGDLRFSDVTDEAGVRDGGLSLGVAWADYDGDDDPDLYVANDFGRNALLRNEGPDASGRVRFADVTDEAGALDFGFGMSASWGDVDNDGDLDIYVSNVHSGQRWYGQATTLYQYLLTSVKQGTVFEDWGTYREIYGFAGGDWKDYGDGMVKGNSLLINDGQGHFTDVAEAANANPFGWYWASSFFDYDNDGRLDVYAANGWISAKSHDDL